MSQSERVGDMHSHTPPQARALPVTGQTDNHHVEMAEGVTPPGWALWLPILLRTPSVSGVMGELKFAFFARKRRLLVEHLGQCTLYACGEHLINDIRLDRNGLGSLVFTSQRGEFSIEALRPLS